MARDYHEIASKIADVIGHGDVPLTDMQRISLTGAVAVWMDKDAQRIAVLEKALREIQMRCRSINDARAVAYSALGL